MSTALKSLLKKLPVPLSKNHGYDLLTKKIIRRHCKATSNCVDAGAHKGEVLDWFLKYAPDGRHFAFEPVPDLFQALQKKYAGRNCEVYDIALSDKKAMTPFNYVISNPAYSGLKKRKYDRKKESDTIIQVSTDTLDHLIPANIPIHFIKIDVEGGEMDVLKGAVRILSDYHPVVVFEFGMGGSDLYGTTPDKMFSFFKGFNYQLFLLNDFIRKRSPLGPGDFSNEFYDKRNYYFVAY